MSKFLNKKVDIEELEYKVSSINKSSIRRVIRDTIIRDIKRFIIKSIIKRYKDNQKR